MVPALHHGACVDRNRHDSYLLGVGSDRRASCLERALADQQ